MTEHTEERVAPEDRVVTALEQVGAMFGEALDATNEVLPLARLERDVVRAARELYEAVEMAESVGQSPDRAPSLNLGDALRVLDEATP